MLSTVLSLFSDMLWQDVVLAVGQIVFIFALLPMVRAKQKPPLFSCLIHGLVLGSFGIVFASLALWFSALAVFAVSGMWFYIGWQRYAKQR